MPKISPVSSSRLMKNRDAFGFPAPDASADSLAGELAFDLFDEWLASYCSRVRPVAIPLVTLRLQRLILDLPQLAPV